MINSICNLAGAFDSGGGGSGFIAWEGFVGVSAYFALVVIYLPFGSPAIGRGEAWERSATLPVATKIAA